MRKKAKLSNQNAQLAALLFKNYTSDQQIKLFRILSQESIKLAAIRGAYQLGLLYLTAKVLTQQPSKPIPKIQYNSPLTPKQPEEVSNES